MSGVTCVLKTGTQGSGKTASAVAELLGLVDSWGSDPELRRPIYVHGIRDLTVEHFTLPVHPVGRPGQDYRRNDRTGQPEEPVAVDWSQVPDGAHVLIDEAQKLFPPRALNAPVPDHVRWFELSRQVGSTVVLMTQAPTSLDVEVRKRCGLHQHYVHLWGRLRSVREWADGVSTSLKAPTTTRVWVVPSSVFGAYKSANVHSKGAVARLPVWVVVPVAALVLAVWAVPSAYRALTGAMGGHGLASSGPAASASASAPGGAASSPVLRPPEGVASGPSSSRGAAVAACISMAGRCQCINGDGYRVELPHAECVQSSREYGYRIPYPTRPPVGEAGASAVVLASAAPGGAGQVVDRAMRDLGAASAGGVR